MGLKVRRVWAYDLEEMVNLAETMSNESERFSKQGFNRERTKELLTYFCLRFENFIGYVAENEEGKLVGMVYLVVADSLTHNIRCATDIAVFVHPNYRGSNVFIRMIKSAETDAIKLGAQEINVGISSGITPEKTVHIFERLGYKMRVFTMVKDFY